MFVKIHK